MKQKQNMVWPAYLHLRSQNSQGLEDTNKPYNLEQICESTGFSKCILWARCAPVWNLKIRCFLCQLLTDITWIPAFSTHTVWLAINLRNVGHRDGFTNFGVSPSSGSIVVSILTNWQVFSARVRSALKASIPWFIIHAWCLIRIKFSCKQFSSGQNWQVQIAWVTVMWIELYFCSL